MPAFCVIMEEKLWAVHRMVYLEKFVFPGGEEEYAIAVPKGSDLKDTINDVLKDLKSSGELDKIVSKYIQAE